MRLASQGLGAGLLLSVLLVQSMVMFHAKTFKDENRKVEAAQRVRTQYLFKTFQEERPQEERISSTTPEPTTSSTTLHNTLKEEHRKAEAETAANNSAAKAATQGSQLAELQRIVQTPRKQISSDRNSADIRMVNEDDFNAKMKQADTVHQP
jgi:hypothetical protein